MSPSIPSPILLRTLETPVGTMLGGATENGVCLCEFLDRGGKEEILARLKERYGRPVIHPPPSGTGDGPGGRPDSAQDGFLGELKTQLAEYFAGDRKSFDLELDLRGTPWQRQVWSALLDIPYGATLSYGDLAARLGKAGGSRAVGGANGSNPVAIVVPCHRVVQADGGLRGYGGGLHRKRWLLDFEAGVRQLTL